MKLPHFELTGKFNLAPPEVPKLSVNWYSSGGIFSSPSVIGVGEAGTEAVVPIDKLEGLLVNALIKSGIGIQGKTALSSAQKENVTNNYKITIQNAKPESATDSIRSLLLKHSYGLI